MSWKLAPSLVALRDSANAYAPKRSKKSDGTIGNEEHSSRASDHNPDENGYVTAMDITHDPAGGYDCHKVVAEFVKSRDKRIKYIIWNDQIWRSYKTQASHPPAWTPEEYTGTNEHRHHMHVSTWGDPARRDDTRKWAMPGTPQEDEVKFTLDEAKKEVVAAFQDIAGRTPSTDDTNVWMHAVATDARKLFELHRALAKESRVRQDRLISEAANKPAPAPATAAGPSLEEIADDIADRIKNG